MDFLTATELRRAYNAAVIAVREVTADLRVFRIRPEGELASFAAGQYGTLGLGAWEPLAPGVSEEPLGSEQRQRLIRRAYSVSCSLLDDRGNLVRVTDCPYLEFYIALVRHGVHPPSLTPRLFALAVGDRLHLGGKLTGNYTLAGVRPEDDVAWFATGTGEAPHNAMLADLLRRGHSGRLLSVVGARQRSDLAYVQVHRELERRYANYRYLTFTTREPENLDPACEGYTGRAYLQEWLARGEIERQCGWQIRPDRTHIFLCGSPAMIGAPTGPEKTIPSGMIATLRERGFRCEGPDAPGTIRWEKFW